MLVWLIGQSFLPLPPFMKGLICFEFNISNSNNFRVDKYFSVLILLNLLIQFIQLILYASPKYFESDLQLQT